MLIREKCIDCPVFYECSGDLCYAEEFKEMYESDDVESEVENNG